MTPCPICKQAPATEAVVGVWGLICKECAEIIKTEVLLQAGYILDQREFCKKEDDK